MLEDPALQLEISSDAGAAVLADPSIFYPPGAPGGALAYSAVPLVNGVADQGGIETRVAVSGNAGASWTFVARANTAASAVPPTCPSGATCTATIVNETPTLLFDPTDSSSRQWKLFTHRYYVLKSSSSPNPILLYTVGNIAMYTAPLPAGPWSAPTVAIGWPGSAFSSSGAAFLSTDAPQTSGCAAFSEPGATLAPDGSIHLALGCVQAPLSNPQIDVVLLRSVDHGASWSYVATPVLGSDGACLGGNGKRMNAADLFVSAGSEYLMATPELANGRAGCAVFHVDSYPDGGAGIPRTAGGAALVERQLAPQFLGNNGVHYAGACTYSEGATATGYTMSFLFVPTDGGLPTIHEVASGLAGP